MKKYPLHAFLRVCKMREEQSQRELAKARAATLSASETLDLATSAYETFKAERPSKEKELFAAIKDAVVSQKRLDEFHLDVKHLIDKEFSLQAEMVEAREFLVKMQQQENKCKLIWQNATKEHSKITEHCKIWQNEQRILQERAEEAEMEGA